MYILESYIPYTVLYYTILYHALVYCTLPYYTILCYTIQHSAVLYYTILLLHCVIVYYNILYYAALPGGRAAPRVQRVLGCCRPPSGESVSQRTLGIFGASGGQRPPNRGVQVFQKLDMVSSRIGLIQLFPSGGPSDFFVFFPHNAGETLSD